MNTDITKVNYRIYDKANAFFIKEESNSENNFFSKYQKEQSVNIDNIFEEKIVSVYDVAGYILSNLPEQACTTMKLHKLLYYCQAWSMVWCEKPLFFQKIEAWANGPVIREFFNFHRGLFSLHYSDLTFGNKNLLSEKQKLVIDDVLSFYGEKEPQWLIDLTHSEDPWIIARKGLAPNERGDREITLDSMQQYYANL